MSSYRARVITLITLLTVLTIVLNFAVQSYYLVRFVRQSESSPLLREAIKSLDEEELMSDEEELKVIQGVLRRMAASEEASRQFLDLLDAQRRVPYIAALLSLPILLLIGSVNVWYVVRPIRHLSEAAAQIARGNLEARAPLSGGPKVVELTTLVQDFNAMAGALEKLELERQNMIADIAHELRTPLAILQGQIDAMREGVRPVNDASLARLDKQTQHLARLVQDLRTLSLAEAGRLSLDLRVLDTAGFTERVTASFDERAAEKSIKLSFMSELDRVTRVKADPDRLEQVVSNLVDNALRHTPEGGKVTISVQNRANQVQLSVADSGPGLSEDALIHVFDRFYRAENQVQGTANSGLGLSITKALVELHGGVINVMNAAQGGAVFRVLLPVAPASVAWSDG